MNTWRARGGKAAPAAARQADATESSRGAACTSSRADRDEGRGWRLLRDMGCDCGLDFFKLKLTSCASRSSFQLVQGWSAIGVISRTTRFGSARTGHRTRDCHGVTHPRCGDRNTRPDTRHRAPVPDRNDSVAASATLSYETHTTPAPPTARHAPRSPHVRGPVAPEGCVKRPVQYRSSDRISLVSATLHSSSPRYPDTSSVIALATTHILFGRRPALHCGFSLYLNGSGPPGS